MFSTTVDTFTLELDTLDHDTLIHQLRAAEVMRRQLEAVQAATVHELDRRETYRRDGHASVAGLVRVVTQRPGSEVVRLIQTGRLMHAEPAVAVALTSGSVGVAQVHLLARAHAHPRVGKDLATKLPSLLADAQRLKCSEFKTRLDTWINITDIDGADPKAAASHDNRDAYFHLWDGEFHGTLQGGTLDGAAMIEILERFTQAEWDKDWAWTQEHHGRHASTANMPRTAPQRRFDALAAIFEAATSTPPGAQPPEPVVNIISDDDTFLETLARVFDIPVDHTRDTSRGERRCETSDGVPVAPIEMIAAALAGHVRRVIVDSQSVVIDLGRKQRLFTGNARSAAHLGIARCIWPGCELPASRSQTDHLTNWANGGHTNPRDGAPCCPRHNLHKNQGYTITRNPDGTFTTRRPDGTEIA